MKKTIFLITITLLFLITGCNNEEDVEYTIFDVQGRYELVDSVTIRHEFINVLSNEIFDQYTLKVDGNKVQEIVGDQTVFALVYDNGTYLYRIGNFGYFEELIFQKLYLTPEEYMPQFQAINFTKNDDIYSYVFQDSTAVQTYTIKLNEDGFIILYQKQVIEFWDESKTDIKSNLIDSFTYSDYNKTDVEIPEVD
jgi:hypothetical protein